MHNSKKANTCNCKTKRHHTTKQKEAKQNRTREEDRHGKKKGKIILVSFFFSLALFSLYLFSCTILVTFCLVHHMLPDFANSNVIPQYFMISQAKRLKTFLPIRHQVLMNFHGHSQDFFFQLNSTISILNMSS